MLNLCALPGQVKILDTLKLCSFSLVHVHYVYYLNTQALLTVQIWKTLETLLHVHVSCKPKQKQMHKKHNDQLRVLSTSKC